MAQTAGGGQEGAGAGAAPAALSVVSSYWREFDLEGMRTKLDESGLKIASYQEEALQNRKKLAESTREFKRSADEQVNKTVGPLLRQYQEEVDRLTKRAKSGESAYLVRATAACVRRCRLRVHWCNTARARPGL